MPSRASALALRLQIKLREAARQIRGRPTRIGETSKHQRPENEMKDAFAASHRTTALFAAAILLMIAGAGGAFYGALADRRLQVSAGAVLFCAGALLFKLWKQNPHRLV
jgi:hypothetical protein